MTPENLAAPVMPEAYAVPRRANGSAGMCRDGEVRDRPPGLASAPLRPRCRNMRPKVSV
jgi:hypothetical protein